MKIFKNNFVVKFVVTLFLFGIAVGAVAYLSFKPDITLYLDEFKSVVATGHNNVFILNLSILTGIFILSIVIAGIPLVLFYIFYEGLSIGYTIAAFMAYYSFKGVLFYLLFFIVIKLIYIIVILYFSIVSIRFAYNFGKYLYEKNKEGVYKVLRLEFIRYILIGIIILINSTLIYFLSNKIISLFIGLII